MLVTKSPGKSFRLRADVTCKHPFLGEPFGLKDFVVPEHVTIGIAPPYQKSIHQPGRLGGFGIVDGQNSNPRPFLERLQDRFGINLVETGVDHDRLLLVILPPGATGAKHKAGDDDTSARKGNCITVCHR